jgi:hypothetical protein
MVVKRATKKNAAISSLSLCFKKRGLNENTWVHKLSWTHSSVLSEMGEAGEQRTSLGVLVVWPKQAEDQECRFGEVCAEPGVWEGVESRQMDQVA